MGKTTPEWLDALRGSTELAEVGVVWLDDAQSESRTETMRTPNPYVPPQLHEEMVRTLSRARLVAVGPDFEMTMGSEMKSFRPAWWVDDDRPGQLFLALSEDTPPLLWIAAGATAASVRDAWKSTLRQDVQRHEDRPKRFPFFGGLMRNPPFGFYELENWFVTSPFTNGFPYRLGSAVPLGSDKGDLYDEPSHTSMFMTAFSRSMIQFTGQHQFVPDATLLYGLVTYAPAEHGDVVARFNAATGSDYPRDMPVDVLGALINQLGRSREQLRDAVDADVTGTRGPDLPVLAEQLMLDPAAGGERLRALREHPSPIVREAAAVAAAIVTDRESLALFRDDPDPAVSARANELWEMTGRPAHPEG